MTTSQEGRRPFDPGQQCFNRQWIIHHEGGGRKSYLYIPSTVSEEWRQQLGTYPDPHQFAPSPAPDDLATWKMYQEWLDAEASPGAMAYAESMGASFELTTIGGVQVRDVRPRHWKDNGKVLVFTHGGAYVTGSATTSLYSSALFADATGLRVVSVDYTLAPSAKWQQVTDQVVAVFAGLEQAGYPPENVAIYGDSAGGGLAAGAVLKMRDQRGRMPAAVVLLSPWSDITETGDTYFTLNNAEPMYIYGTGLKSPADAYANPEDQKNPYVSPVYGDYSLGFPPTLIQGGTKEIFLSNFIRHYQALDTAGQTVKLDLYEGMVHVFQTALPNSPESTTARNKITAFLRQHLIR